MKKSVVVNVSSITAECILDGLVSTVSVLRRPKIHVPFIVYLWNGGNICGSFVCREIRCFTKCNGYVLIVSDPKKIDRLARDMFPDLKRVLAWSYVEEA